VDEWPEDGSSPPPGPDRGIPLTLQHVSGRRPGWPFESLIALVGALVILAIVKPWDGPSIAGRIVPLPPLLSEAAPAATQDLSPEGVAESVCLGTAGWRLATLERWRLVIGGVIEIQKVSVWRAMTPIENATDPTDPRIPIIGVAGEEIDAVGWCAPAEGPSRPAGPADVTLWRLDPSGAVIVPVQRILPARGTTQLAALYAQIGSCAGSLACAATTAPPTAPPVLPIWGGGRFVFRYQDRGNGQAWWFGADIQVLVAPTAPPLPAATGPAATSTSPPSR
jgi:hypothetical protein